MWWKIATGALTGFIIGSFVAPGYTLWVTAGVITGYIADVLSRRGEDDDDDEFDD